MIKPVRGYESNSGTHHDTGTCIGMVHIAMRSVVDDELEVKQLLQCYVKDQIARRQLPPLPQ